MGLLSLIFTAAFNNALASTTFAAPATSFYRSPQSLFVSGQSTRESLEKNLRGEEFQHRLRVSWNKNEYWLKAQNVLRDLDCARDVLVVKKALLHERDLSSSRLLGTLSKDQELELLQIKSSWAHVKSKKLGITGWVAATQLRSKNEDMGFFINLIDTSLRKDADHQSAMVTTIPKGVRMTMLGFDNGFLKTQYLHHTGYVDLSHLVSRADFAIWGYHTQKKWILISHRENEFVLTPDKEKYFINDFTSFAGNPAKAVVLESEDGPPLRAHVQILESRAFQWALSEMPGHGMIWWKKEKFEDTTLEERTETKITSQQLLDRQVFSLALQSGKTIRGLVSAKGIFRTEDGQQWTQIRQFGHHDLPVAVHSDGTWFVGSYKSRDHGKTFEPFIRWDQLANLIEGAIGRQPRHIRLQKFESLLKNQLQITVDTGPKHVQLRYQIPTSSWSVVK